MRRAGRRFAAKILFLGRLQGPWRRGEQGQGPLGKPRRPFACCTRPARGVLAAVHAISVLRAVNPSRRVGLPLGDGWGFRPLPLGTALSVWVFSEGGCPNPPHPKIGYSKGESAMFFIDMQLVPGDLAARMCDMRIWLDRHKVETLGFSLKGRTMVRVGFRAKLEAEAFAVWAAGREARH
jgi:hypothetical protein